MWLDGGQDANVKDHELLRADMYTFRKLLGKTEEGQDGTRKWTPEFVQANHRVIAAYPCCDEYATRKEACAQQAPFATKSSLLVRDRRRSPTST